MTYAEILQAIKDFAVDAEPTFYTNIPEFVQATERRIYNAVPDLPSFQADAAPTVAQDTATVTMPADFLSVDSFAIIVAGVRSFLVSKTVDFVQSAYPTLTGRGVPRYYAVSNATTLTLAPIPDTTYVSELSYLAYPESIVTADTTWLGTNYPEALLYGSLRDAAVYLKEEADIVAMYDKMYAEALGQTTDFATTRGTVDFRGKQDVRKLPR